MLIPLQLLSILKHHSDAHDKQDIDTDDTESSGEHFIEVFVGEGGEGTDAAALLGRDEIVFAGVVHDEGGGGFV